MPKKDKISKDTDRDVKPTRGQESNENWDDANNDRDTSKGSRSNAISMDEETNTTGAGSSQRNKQENVGPLDSDLSELPSEKRADRGNATGPGLG
jgi:hypothetical protein